MGADVDIAERSGIVERTQGNGCWVRLDPGGCPGCHCGMASRSSLHLLTLPAGRPIPGPGTRVRVEMSALRLRQVAWVAFGGPLAGLLVFAILGERWIEGGGPVGGLVGLAGGLLISRLAAQRLQRRRGCRPSLVVA